MKSRSGQPPVSAAFRPAARPVSGRRADVQQRGEPPPTPARGLRDRCRLPEVMDDPTLHEDLHHAALAGLRRINQVSRSGAVLWPALRRLASEQTRPLRVFDVACGGGDVVVSLSRRARRAGVDIQIDGCDISDRAVRHAAQFAGQCSPASHWFVQRDALRDELPADYDVMTCSLFLHHLSEHDAVTLLKRMAAACRQAVLISDLRRTQVGYFLAVAGCRLLTRSPVVHVDGPLSVRAAWQDREVKSLARRAGMSAAALTRHWPQRFLLSWRKP